MDWIKIGEINAPELSTIAWNVLRYAQRHKIGLHGREIKITRLALRIGENTMQEALYEIRKRESIIMGKLTNAQKAAIYQAWKDGMPQAELAKQYGVTSAAICQLVKKLNKAGKSMGIKPVAETPQVDTAALPEQKPAVINPEFDAAVDEMIAESKAADAEELAAIAEPEAEAQDESEPLPPVVRRAVDGHLAFIADRIEALQYRISEIEIEIEEYRKDASRLEEWKEQQKWR